jgi:hypothetical protein
VPDHVIAAADDHPTFALRAIRRGLHGDHGQR